jgi:hypothetical protein
MFIRTQWDLEQIEEYLPKPAPLLETVEICTYHERPCGLVLPPGFFQTFLSSARTLNLRGAVLCPRPCTLSKLTTFFLRIPTSGSTSAVLLDTLEQMSLLEVFEVSFWYEHQQDPVPRGRTVTLSPSTRDTPTSSFLALTTPRTPGRRGTTASRNPCSVTHRSTTCATFASFSEPPLRA